MVKKVTLYIPEEQHRQLAACLAAHGQKISPLALRLLKDWCEGMVEDGDEPNQHANEPHEAKPVKDDDAVAAVQAILHGDNQAAKAGLLALLQTWAPDAFDPTFSVRSAGIGGRS